LFQLILWPGFITPYLLSQLIGDPLVHPIWEWGQVSIQGLIKQVSMAREHVKKQVRVFKREDKQVPRT
jgi:hypothetical protein